MKHPLHLRKIPILISLFIFGIGIQFSSCASGKNMHNDIATERIELKPLLKKVADWQISNFEYKTSGNLHDYGVDAWTNATLYIGMLEWAKIANDSSYYSWLLNKASVNDWQIPSNFVNYPKYQKYHADELCIGQAYLGLFDLFVEEKKLSSTKKRVDWIMSNPPDSSMLISNKQSWTWCDALFMAPPVYAHLANIENDIRYVQFMDKEFKRTYHYLYDKTNKLFFRDSSYLNKKEANGENVFWGRGNGWVAASLVQILKLLPEDSDYRKFYEDLFKDFIPRLVELQDSNGFWHASLLDPESYPFPETSATALITYALAYGINQGLLDKEQYGSTLKKSWSALQSAVNSEGKLGWVQPIGADPRKVTSNMTAAYGVGAFLLAGTELNTYYLNF